MKSLIFELSVGHQYWPNSTVLAEGQGDSYQLTLVPSPQTQAFIDRYQLLALIQPGFFALYHTGPASIEVFNQALDNLLEQQPFVLELRCNDPDFLIISDVPTDWRGHMIYSSQNTDPDPQPTDSGATTLVQQLQPAELCVGSQVGNLVGNVSIYAADLALSRQYQMTIAARQTYWQYYVFNRSKVQMDDPLVTNRDGIEFENAGEVRVQNGEQALLFKLPGQLLPLQGSEQTRFDLVNLTSGSAAQTDQGNKLSNSTTLVKGLPIPKTNRIDVTLLDGQSYVYSQMYVYL